MANQSRRNFLRSTSALVALPGIASVPTLAHAARRQRFKLGHDLPVSHPVHLRLQQAAARIGQKTGGQFELQVFGGGQLGRAADMFTQVRSGAIQMTLAPDVVVATLTPAASITAVGFAFNDQQAAFEAVDGELGAYIRNEINKSGLQVMDKIWENGFRQITSSVKPIKTPADLHGFKIRVPVSPLVVSMFQKLGAGPTALNLGEVYTSLQTRVVDGEENPLTTIYTENFFEVQKYCSMTNHQWNGDWMLMNSAAWNAVPAPTRQIVADEINRSALDLRADVDKLNTSLVKTLTDHGMVFNDTDPKLFRAVLKQAGFYAEWRTRFGAEGWAALSRYATGLA